MSTRCDVDSGCCWATAEAQVTALKLVSKLKLLGSWLPHCTLT